MKIVAIVQARMGSTRLPGKVLMKLDEKAVLSHVIRRLKAVPLIDEVVIATTTNASDDLIVEECIHLNVPFYRGSESHVLSRYYEAALKHKADIVVRVTSDCPVIDPEVTNSIIKHYFEQSVDYVSNTIERTFPRGLDTEVFSMNALKIAYEQAYSQAQYEHVTPFLYQHPEQFKLSFFKYEDDYSHYRWTLDTEEDYRLLKEIYSHLYRSNEIFNWGQILKLMHERPELVTINAHIEQKQINE